MSHNIKRTKLSRKNHEKHTYNVCFFYRRAANKSKADQLTTISREEAKEKTSGTKRQEKSLGDSTNCYEENDSLGKTMASCNGNGVGSLHVVAENSKCPLLADWKRPDGPTNIWRIVESSGLRFSIQDISEDRYDEAIKHMSDYFMADEATCKALSAYINIVLICVFISL